LVEGIGRTEGAAVGERDVAGGGLNGGKIEAPAKSGHQEDPNGGAGLWIAKRLEMGHWRTAANAVGAYLRK